jgi:hypothetical protein
MIFTTIPMRLINLYRLFSNNGFFECWSKNDFVFVQLLNCNSYPNLFAETKNYKMLQRKNSQLTLRLTYIWLDIEDNTVGSLQYVDNGLNFSARFPYLAFSKDEWRGQSLGGSWNRCLGIIECIFSNRE